MKDDSMQSDPEEIRPLSGSTLHEAAVRSVESGRLDDAIALFKSALAANDASVRTLKALAEIYHRKNRYDDAAEVLQSAVDKAPEDAECWKQLGIARRRLKQSEAAVAALMSAIERSPQDAETHYELGAALADGKRFPEAKSAYLAAIELRADFVDALNNLGVTCQEVDDLEGAVRYLREAVRLAPASVSALNNLGVALSEARQYQDSIDCYHKVLAIDPDYIIAWNNLANSLRALEMNVEAELILKRVVRRKPDYAEAYNNLALVQIQLGHLNDAMVNFDRALILRPDYPECRVNRAMKYLLVGDHDRGWTDYEWRWYTRHLRGREFRGQKWDGSSLSGKRILLACEQGLGDTFQFIRYAIALKSRGATVIFEGQPAVRQMLSRTAGIDEFVSRGESLPPFDFYAPLLSLPGILQTTSSTIPAPIPYIFGDPDLIARWRPRVNSLGGKLRIGIVWQGNPRFGSDSRRSTRLVYFEPLARLEGVRLISLQRGTGSEQLHAEDVAFEVTAFAGVEEQSDGFLRTSAILKNLDLVIAVDTGVAHLAGAMGLPTWVLLPFANDWRWQVDRDDTPWYPTMRLFRQTRPGDWPEVFSRVTEALAERLRQPAPEGRTLSSANLGRYADLLKRASEELKNRKFVEARTLLEAAAQINSRDWRAFHDIGVSHAEQGDLPMAIGLFQRAIELAPTVPVPYANLGLAFLDSHKFDEAVSQFESAIQHGGGSADVYLHLGRSHAAVLDLESAEKSLRRALRLKPHFPKARHFLAKVLLLQGQFAEGWLEFEWRESGPRTGNRPGPKWSGEPLNGQSLLVEAAPDLPHSIMFLGFTRRLKEAGARVVFRGPAALVGLARSCPHIDEVLNEADAVDARLALVSLLSIPALTNFPSLTMPQPWFAVPSALESRVHSLLQNVRGLRIGITGAALRNESQGGRTAADRDDWLESLRQLPGVSLILLDATLQQAPADLVRLDLQSIDTDPLLAVASALANLDFVVCAAELLAHVAGAVGVRGVVCATDADPWPWGSQSCQRWYPNLEVVRPHLGRDRGGSMTLILAKLQAMVASGGYMAADPEANRRSEAARVHRAGVRSLAEGDIQKALLALEQAVDLDPESAAAHLDLGVAQARSRRLADAVRSFRRSIELDRNLEPAKLNLIQGLLDLGQKDEARKLLEIALAESHENPALQIRYARLLQSQGMFEAAIEWWRRSAKSRPHSVEASGGLAESLQACGRPEEALAAWNTAIELDPSRSQSLQGRAELLISLRRFAEAVPDLRALTQGQPENPAAHRLLGLALLNEGRLDDALQSLQRSIYLQPADANTHLILGRCLLRKRQYAQASLEMEWRLRQWPEGRTRFFSVQRWLGQPVNGKRLLFIAEPSASHSLRFIRFARQAADAGANVVVACPEEWIPVLQRLSQLPEFTALGGVPSNFDYQTPMLSAAIGLQAFGKAHFGGESYRSRTSDAVNAAEGRVGVFVDQELLTAILPQLPTPHTEFCIPQLRTGAEFSPLGAESDVLAVRDLSQWCACIAGCSHLITTSDLLADLGSAMGLRVCLIQSDFDDLWLREGSTTPWYANALLLDRPARHAPLDLVAPIRAWLA